jgi:starch synthase
MRVLYVTPELTPIVKTGGLGDVAGSLPAVLKELGTDARILLPGYTRALDALSPTALTGEVQVLPGLPPVQILRARLPDSGTPVYLVHCPELYQRDGGPYQDAEGAEWPDNAIRFGLFSRVAAWLGTSATPIDGHPDIIHCNDWQTALVPAYLRFAPDRSARTVLSIHNMAFLGEFSGDLVDTLGLPRDGYHTDGFEFHGHLSFLKAGLQFADKLTTVSPTYTREIQQPAFGFGLDGVLRQRRDDLHGILNGIDDAEWNPDVDSHIAQTYNVDTLQNKSLNKQALRAQMGLDDDDATPLVGMVCRLSAQKGIDLALGAMHQLADRPFQVVVLGSGSRVLEGELRTLSQAAPGRFAFTSEFNEGLAHLIEAASDMFLMPSLFEPCGLNQMYSMRYGTIPIVRRTGGLADTVTNATPENLRARQATGVVFDDANVDGVTWALGRALDLYENVTDWRSMQEAGMQSDWSWTRSARAYQQLYAELVPVV